MGFFCFFKQKTAYEMRISDWSSDVCSSDLADLRSVERHRRIGKARIAEAIAERIERRVRGIEVARYIFRIGVRRIDRSPGVLHEIGRASCRERVCPYV